jgi:hypothetical protein
MEIYREMTYDVTSSDFAEFFYFTKGAVINRSWRWGGSHLYGVSLKLKIYYRYRIRYRIYGVSLTFQNFFSA